jgi:predicted esterase
MIKQNISVSKTARYYLSGEITDKIKSVWFVLHGYGQLAEEFIHNFEPILNDQTLVVAPDALNRFYWKGFHGKIGATWMTKEDRLNEIKDYVNFLDILYNEVMSKIQGIKIKVTVLGFSQGTATACRWVVNSKIKVEKLILWGGTIPPDINNKESEKILEASNLAIVIGDKDEFIDENLIDREIKHLDENKLIYKLIRFNGKHEIKPEILRQFE